MVHGFLQQKEMRMKALEKLVKEHGVVRVLEELKTIVCKARAAHCAVGTEVEIRFFSRLESILGVALYAMENVTREEA